MDGKTRRFKNGDYRAYKWFTDTQWAGLSERDKAMWTEYSDEEPAPIPAEVLEFKKENDLETVKPCCKDADECKRLEDEVLGLRVNKEALIQENSELKRAIIELKAENLALKGVPADTENDALDEEAEKQLIKDKLTELGVPFRANTGLPKLKDKLKAAEDADDTE